MKAEHHAARQLRASFLHANGLSLAFIGLTLLSLVGHLLAGYTAASSERVQLALPALALGQYARSAETVPTSRR